MPNTYRLKYFITKGSTGINENRPPFDHVVVVRGYVGPMRPAGTGSVRAGRLEGINERVEELSCGAFSGRGGCDARLRRVRHERR